MIPIILENWLTIDLQQPASKVPYKIPEWLMNQEFTNG